MSERTVSDRLFTAELEEGLRNEGFCPFPAGRIRLYSFGETASTMDDAKQAAQGRLAGVPRPFDDAPAERRYSADIIVAETQTAGRGRERRAWYSPSRSGIFVTYLLKLRLPVHELVGASLTAGVALLRAVERLGAENVRLKWPNDLLYSRDGHFWKLGGILCETVLDEGELYSLSLGIGLNLYPAAYPPGVAAVALAECSTDAVTFAGAFGVLTREVFTAFDTFATVGFAPLREAWLRMSVSRPGDTVRVRLSAEQEIQGTFLDLGAQGELILKGAGGAEVVLSAGELSGFL